MSDVILDGDSQVTVLCDNLNVQGHDLLLDASARRQPGGPRFRRALVHDEGDGLTVNFADDYPGGVTLNGVTSITPRQTTHIPGALRDGPVLVVHGGISYEVPGIQLVGGGRTATITVSLEAELDKLQSQITDLTTRLAKLEGH